MGRPFIQSFQTIDFMLQLCCVLFFQLILHVIGVRNACHDRHQHLLNHFQKMDNLLIFNFCLCQSDVTGQLIDCPHHIHPIIGLCYIFCVNQAGHACVTSLCIYFHTCSSPNIVLNGIFLIALALLAPRLRHCQKWGACSSNTLCPIDS